MNLELNFGQISGIVIGGLLLQTIAASVLLNIFKARATDWHEDNQKRFTKIERALGIDDPDDSSFPRRSEMEKLIGDNDKAHDHIWNELGAHDVRIKRIENKNP